MREDFGETQALGDVGNEHNGSGLGGLRTPADNDGGPPAGSDLQGH